MPPGVEDAAPLAPEWVECPYSGSLPQRYFYSCWRGKIAGEDIGLDAGRETEIAESGKGDTGPIEFDCCQGALRVENYGPNGEVFRSETYPTPLKLGFVRLVSVKGTRVTLAPYGSESPDNTFVFDIATREWIKPRAKATNTSKFGRSTCYIPYEYGWQYRFEGCWSGLVHGRIMSLASGYDSFVGDNYPNSSQGILMVFDGPDFDFGAGTARIFKTPSQAGPIDIALIDDALVYLKSTDDKTEFVFDLASLQWVTPSIMPTPSTTRTPMVYVAPPTPKSTEEAIEQRRSEWRTALAQLPTDTPTQVPGTKPEGVWRFERIDCDATMYKHNEDFVSCWAGIGNGTILGVRSLETASLDDPSQGMIAVFQGIYPFNVATYRTPLKVGTARIVSIEGPLVKLTSEDGQFTFLFDLATSQWVPPGTGRTAPITKGVLNCSHWGAEQYYSCWRGIINGEIVWLYAGRESGISYSSTPPYSKTILDECCAGLLRVNSVKENNESSIPAEEYKTAEKVGALYIVSVKGTRVTLASYDPNFTDKTFVFDISTRQWVNP